MCTSCPGPFRFTSLVPAIFMVQHPGLSPSGSWCVLTQLSEHQPNRCPAQEGKRFAVQALALIGHPTTAIELPDRPARSQPPSLELRPVIAGTGIKLEQERIKPERGAHQQHPLVPVAGRPSTIAALSRPWASTRAWRLSQVVFLPASYQPWFLPPSESEPIPMTQGVFSNGHFGFQWPGASLRCGLAESR
jgi:hypothetical protein